MGQRMDDRAGKLTRLGALNVGKEHVPIFKRGVVLLRQIDDFSAPRGSAPSQRWISGVTMVAADR